MKEMPAVGCILNCFVLSSLYLVSLLFCHCAIQHLVALLMFFFVTCTCHEKYWWSISSQMISFLVSQSLVVVPMQPVSLTVEVPTLQPVRWLCSHTEVLKWAQWYSTSVGSQGLLHQAQAQCVEKMRGGTQTPLRWFAQWYQQQCPHQCQQQ